MNNHEIGYKIYGDDMQLMETNITGQDQIDPAFLLLSSFYPHTTISP
ncbi:hypothetical protein [Neobacillus bataviensis]|nr:hypothetical protein [Neobacillus bataviensis]